MEIEKIDYSDKRWETVRKTIRYIISLPFSLLFVTFFIPGIIIAALTIILGILIIAILVLVVILGGVIVIAADAIIAGSLFIISIAVGPVDYNGGDDDGR